MPFLTFFQGPLDRARLLANGVQVSIQGGHKEQAFRKRNRAGTAEPLRRENENIDELVTSVQPDSSTESGSKSWSIKAKQT